MNPMPFHLESLWGATLMPHRVCDGLRQNEIVMVCINSSSVLSRLWTKVHDALGQRRRPFALSNALALLSMSCSVLQIFAIKSQSRRETEQLQMFFSPNFFGGMTPTFLQQVVSAIYRPPFGKVWLSSVCSVCDELECRIYGRYG